MLNKMIRLESIWILPEYLDFQSFKCYRGGSTLVRVESKWRITLWLYPPASILHINPFFSWQGDNCHTPSGILRAIHRWGLTWSISGFRMPQFDWSVGVPSNHFMVSSVEKLLTYYELYAQLSNTLSLEWTIKSSSSI